MKNTINTTMLSTLIAAILVPFSGVSTADAGKSSTYDPDMVNYLSEVIQNIGESVEEKTLDGAVYTVTKTVTQTSENSYSAVNTVSVDGVAQSTEIFQVTENDDGIFTLSNSSIGLDKTFTDASINVRGSGYSSYSGASMVLSDTEYGSANTLRLYDNYAACTSNSNYTFNHAVMEGS